MNARVVHERALTERGRDDGSYPVHANKRLDNSTAVRRDTHGPMERAAVHLLSNGWQGGACGARTGSAARAGRARQSVATVEAALAK
eukprot:scaffold58398_cov84-Phaeocystis_antarctica.AAC.2